MVISKEFDVECLSQSEWFRHEKKHDCENDGDCKSGTSLK